MTGNDRRRYEAINYLRGSHEGRVWLSKQNLRTTDDQRIIFKAHEVRTDKAAKALIKVWR